MPSISKHFTAIQPSAIRQAQIEFDKRKDNVKAINVAVGNVQLPMHPAMQARMFALDANESPFKAGVVGYTGTVGTAEANDAMKQILRASGIEVTSLHTHITSGGSEAMELVILGVCSPDRPLLVIDPIYTNYHSLAKRVGVPVVALPRGLNDDGMFAEIDYYKIDELIKLHNPGALLVIPYDNPTGSYINHEMILTLARICVEHDMWFVSDEAYRELHYGDRALASIWLVNDVEVPGISGRRVSIESSSKVWNACGLRIGAIVSDNEEFHRQAVAEHTTTLCAGAISQYVFGALAHESVADLQMWFKKQRDYYHDLITTTVNGLKSRIRNLIVSAPEAALYSVVDFRNLVDEKFSAQEFGLFCAREGKVEIDGEWYTLLVAPMAGFYTDSNYVDNPGRTQIRIAYVHDQQTMQKVPELLDELLRKYLLKK